jgi:hypothetical protein
MNKLTPARGIKLVLLAQLGIAAILFGADLARVLPTLGVSAPNAPRLTQPVLPGDQTRRYDRRHAPAGPDTPDTGDMPSRLIFELSDGVLSLTGAIAEGDGARLADWLMGREVPMRVLLHSTGGSVQDALEIGRFLRAQGAATAVQAGRVCLSACPYIFASGVDRRAHVDAFIGVHQHSFGTNTALPAFLLVEDIQRGQGEVMAYLIEMGVDPALMQHALVTPPEAIYILLADELTAYQLATEISEDG